MIEMYQLWQLLAIADCDNLSKAAEQLYLSGYSEISLQDLEGEMMLLFHDLGYWSHVHRGCKTFQRTEKLSDE